MRVVIDTNIIVSALLTPAGNAYAFLHSVFGGQYEVVITESILREYGRVLRRKEFAFSEDEIGFLLQWFRKNALMVEVDENDYPKEIMRDKTDAVFYVAARCTGAKLVTGNIKHYPVEEMRTMLWELM